MSLSVNIPLEKALDTGWEILAECFDPNETSFRSELINKFWPKIIRTSVQVKTWQK